jgi:hypothetical protein
VALPPTTRVAATTANAVRERVSFAPAFTIFDANIDQSLSSIATSVASGTPAPVSTAVRFGGQCGTNLAVKPIRVRLKYLVIDLV